LSFIFISDGGFEINLSRKENKMKTVYCAQCGTRLEVFRKALKGYGRIIDLIQPHKCPEEPIELDLTPTEIPVKSPEGKFVQNLDILRPSNTPSVSTADFRDRRTEVKSTAPASLLDQIKLQNPSIPENDISSEPEGGE